MNIHAIIVDDEEPNRNYLRNLIKDLAPDITVTGECDSVESALEMIKEKKPGLIFLDIELKGRNGFEVIEKTTFRDFDIIFTTAYKEYAIKAIRYAALDYLLKPIDPEEFVIAAERVRKNQRSQVSSKLDFLMKNGLNGTTPMQRIILPTTEELIIVNLSDIISIEGSNYYSVFHLADGKHHVVSKTIQEYEKMLMDAHFFRIHKSHIINLNHIKKYVKGRGGAVVMSNNTTIAVSLRKKDEFLQALYLLK